MKKGWEVKTLGEVCEKTSLVNPSRSPDQTFEYIDVSSVDNKSLRITEVQTLLGSDAPSRARKLVRQDDVIFATVRPTLRRIAVIPQELDGEVCSTGYVVLRAGKLLNHRWLFHIVQSEEFISRIGELQSGTSYPAVTDGQVKMQLIPIPPLSEQKRIVGILDRAFAAIDAAKANAEKNLENARAIFDSHLNRVFTERGEGWEEKTLGEVGVDILSGFAFRSDTYTESGHFVVRIGNVQHGQVVMSNPRYVRLNDPKLTRFEIEEGDLLISLTGNIGRVGMIQREHLPAVVNQRVALLRVGKREVDRDFLFRYFMTEAFRSGLQSSGHGSAQQNVSPKQLARSVVPQPDLVTQRHISAFISEIECKSRALTFLYQRKLELLEELRQSLLHRAFTGEL